MSDANVSTRPICLGCRAPMDNILGRDQHGLYMSGFGCYGCEGWYVPFRDGVVRVREDQACDVVFAPLGDFARYLD